MIFAVHSICLQFSAKGHLQTYLKRKLEMFCEYVYTGVYMRRHLITGKNELDCCKLKYAEMTFCDYFKSKCQYSIEQSILRYFPFHKFIT